MGVPASMTAYACTVAMLRWGRCLWFVTDRAVVPHAPTAAGSSSFGVWWAQRCYCLRWVRYGFISSWTTPQATACTNRYVAPQRPDLLTTTPNALTFPTVGYYISFLPLTLYDPPHVPPRYCLVTPFLVLYLLPCHYDQHAFWFTWYYPIQWVAMC